jgi:hypothetical protein
MSASAGEDSAREKAIAELAEALDASLGQAPDFSWFSAAIQPLRDGLAAVHDAAQRRQRYFWAGIVGLLLAAAPFVPWNRIFEPASDNPITTLVRLATEQHPRPHYDASCPEEAGTNPPGTTPKDCSDLRAAETKTELLYAQTDQMDAKQAHDQAQKQSDAGLSAVGGAIWRIVRWVLSLSGVALVVLAGAAFFAVGGDLDRGEASCLAHLGEFVAEAAAARTDPASIFSPGVLRAAMRSGALLSLFNALAAGYLTGWARYADLRRLAADLSDSQGGDTRGFYDPAVPPIEPRAIDDRHLPLIHAAAVRAFLRRFTGDPGFSYILYDQRERGLWTRRLPGALNLFSGKDKPPSGTGPELAATPALILLLLLFLGLLPLAGSYLGANSSSQRTQDETRVLSQLSQLQGAPGRDGQAGPAGPAGAPGAAGAPGVTGRDGLQGPTGKDGPPGAQGPKGPDGQQGPAGRDGRDAVPPCPGDKSNPCANGSGQQQGTSGQAAGSGQTAGAAGEVLVAFRGKTTGDPDPVRLVYSDGSCEDFHLTLSWNSTTAPWPPDPIALTVGASPAGADPCKQQDYGKVFAPRVPAAAAVSAAQKPMHSSVLNASVWIEASEDRHWYRPKSQNLLVIHILPR